jgi:YidC/Oxa1 family membrane protein insertase
MWNTLIYDPLYNAFVFVLTNTPNHNIAIAIVIFTILVKTLLFPLYQKNIRSQQLIKLLEPDLKEIQVKYKGDRTELGKKTMELYKTNNINPFTSILLLLIQLPILIALYFVFSRGLTGGSEHLYSFVSFPEQVNTMMFGFIEATKPFIPLGILAGLTQAMQARVSFPKLPKSTAVTTEKKEVSFQDEFAKSMRVQVLYVLPVFITVISIGFPSAITLYWVVANIFGTLQESYVKRTIKVKTI